MAARRVMRSAAVSSVVVVPLALALGAPARAGSSDVIPPMSPSNMPDFSHPTKIDNEFFPLEPGTEWVYKGTVTEAGGSTPHEVIFTVSTLTKVIDGVKTRVVWDRDFGDGELEEVELAFFAQDDKGRVWNFGEYPEEYANGKFDGAPNVWITGLDGARGGIHMLADPEVGDAYVEGLVRKIDFYDVSTVAAKGLNNCVPTGCYDDVLYVKETSPLDKTSGIQTKYYAPDTGLIRIGAIGGDSQERMTLRSMKVLHGDALDAVDQEVKRLDRRGHRISDVYSETDPVR